MSMSRSRLERRLMDRNGSISRHGPERRLMASCLAISLSLLGALVLVSCGMQRQSPEEARRKLCLKACTFVDGAFLRGVLSMVTTYRRGGNKILHKETAA